MPAISLYVSQFFTDIQSIMAVVPISCLFIYLLIKHDPLPWVILHAIGIQLGSISGDTEASITRCRQSLHSLYNFTVLVMV
jgi:hypothetical protein